MTSWLAFRRALDRLALYLPLLAMALLAMGSWWLVRSMSDVWDTPVGKVVRKEPDYHLEHFTTQVFDAQGRSIRQVGGDKARHFPDSDELHIDAVRFAAVNEAGAHMKVTARQGIVAGDGDRVTLLGHVQAVRAAHGSMPRIELRAERLLVLQKQERMLSNDAVEILRGNDRFTAQGLDFDTRTGQYQLKGRVHGVLQPTVP